MNRGKLVILFIFGLSTAMGVFAWIYNYAKGDRCLQLWGTDAAMLIRFAPQVDEMELAAESESSTETIRIGEQMFGIVRRKEITNTPDLKYLRESLTLDRTFDWEAPSDRLDARGDWQYALRFTDTGQSVTIVFDFAARKVRIVEGEGEREGRLKAEFARAFQRLLPRWLGTEAY